MVTQVISVLHKLELSPRATKLTRCVSNLRTHPELSLVLPVLACTKRVGPSCVLGTAFRSPIFRLQPSGVIAFLDPRHHLSYCQFPLADIQP